MTDWGKRFVLNIVTCPVAVRQAQKENNYTNVMRPSQWGNPFVVGRDGTRTEVLVKYRAYLIDRMTKDPQFKAETLALKGRILGCHCLPLPCHAEVIVALLWGDSD